MRNSSTRPSWIAEAARPAPPIETSLSVAFSAAAASSATDVSAPGISLNAVECAAEDDLRDRAPDVGKRGPGLVVAQRRIRLPHQHRLVEPAAEEIPAKLAYLREVKAEQLVARRRPPERAVAVGDKAVHRDAHRVDQHGFRLSGRSDRRWSVMRSTLRLDIGLCFLLRCRPARSPWERTPAISSP